MIHRMSDEYRALVDSEPRIERGDVFAHSTYDGAVSLCHRRISRDYAVSDQPRCPLCAVAALSPLTRAELETVAVEGASLAQSFEVTHTHNAGRVPMTVYATAIKWDYTSDAAELVMTIPRVGDGMALTGRVPVSRVVRVVRPGEVSGPYDDNDGSYGTANDRRGA